MINKIPGNWVLFKIRSAFLFDGIESQIIAIQFRGKAFENLLKKVNDKQEPLALSFLDVVPPLLSENWLFTQEILKKDGNADESGPMNTNAYFIVKDYKNSNRVEGYNICTVLLIQHQEILSNWVEQNTKLWKSVVFKRKQTRKSRISSWVNSMEYIKLSKASQEHASSVFVMMILLITSSSHEVQPRIPILI